MNSFRNSFINSFCRNVFIIEIYGIVQALWKWLTLHLNNLTQSLIINSENLKQLNQKEWPETYPIWELISPKGKLEFKIFSSHFLAVKLVVKETSMLRSQNIFFNIQSQACQNVLTAINFVTNKSFPA